MNSSENIRCDKCSNLGDKSHRFCKNCGQRIEQIKSNEITCLGIIDDKPCAKIITYDTRFCPNCGIKNPKYVSEENTSTKDDCFKESSQRKDVKEQSVAISSANKEKSFSEDDCFKESSQRKDVKEQSVEMSAAKREEATAVSCDNISTAVDDSSSDIEVGEELDSDIIEEITDLASLKDEILRHLRLGDIVSYAKTLSEQANLMKKVKVKVAVAGESTTGKSTFINAIRGVKSGEEGFAKVGFGNTTMTVNKYRHPQNKRIVFYDLPGYNTTKMPVELFLKEVSISKFDLFLIFFTAVLTEADKQIVDQLRPAGVKFCFIRAKIDDDINDAVEIRLQQDDVLSEIKHKLDKSMGQFEDLKSVKIFYISSKKPSIGEMNKLITFMEEEVAPAKFEAVLFSIPSFTKEVIQKKYKTLKRRVLFLAIRFAVLYRLFACSKIKEEIEMFYRVFQLDKDLAKLVKNLKHRYSAEYMCTHFEDFKRQGSDLSSVNQRYRFCKKFMTDLLDELTEDANAIYQYILDEETQL